MDIYGKVRNYKGRIGMPFRYPGQYYDWETGLYYNRFRYYDPGMGGYISQDPIGLAGGNPTLYGYVQDVNTSFDPFGLSSFDPFAVGELTSFPEDLHFGQNRIGPNFSDIGSQAESSIRGRPISDVVADMKSGKMNPNDLVISYTVDLKSGKNVTLNNRGLAAIVESGRTPDFAIKIPYDKVKPNLLKDIANRLPLKSIDITLSKNGSGLIRKVGCPK